MPEDIQELRRRKREGETLLLVALVVYLVGIFFGGIPFLTKSSGFGPNLLILVLSFILGSALVVIGEPRYRARLEIEVLQRSSKTRRKCEVCGFLNDESDVFCGKCGSKL